MITYDRMTQPRDWDASTYQRLSAPMTAMGTDVLDRLLLDGDETVLDAGCGTGGVTRLLLERLPRGHVIAVDGSRSMVERARAELPASARRPRGGPARARARRAGGRGPLDGDVPLDPRPSAAVRAAARGAQAGRPARRPVRRLRQRGGGQAGRAGRGAGAAVRRAPGGLGDRLAVRDAARTPRRGCARPGSPTSGAGSRASTSTRATRSPTCARSASARSSSGCPRSCTPASWRRRSSGSRTPLVIHYVRLNILARRA